MYTPICTHTHTLVRALSLSFSLLHTPSLTHTLRSETLEIRASSSMHIYMRVSVCEGERERESVCVFVCVCVHVGVYSSV